MNNYIKNIAIGLGFGLLFTSSVIAQQRYSYNYTNNPNQNIANFHANISAVEFGDKFNKGLSVLINEYRTIVKSPLDARLLNIADPKIYRFLKASTNQDFKEHFLAMKYFPNYKVNDFPTSFCFILYDDKKRIEVQKYYTLFPNNDFALSYLMTHEFGHCIQSHQQQVRGISSDLSPKEGEGLADMFSYAYFKSKGYPDISESILKFAKLQKANELHNNGSQVQIFADYYNRNEEKFKNKNIIEIYDIALSFYTEGFVPLNYYSHNTMDSDIQSN